MKSGFAVYADGSTYQGPYKNNLMDGDGVYKWIQGHEYHGHFKEGMMDGNGEFTHSSKHTVKGVFKRNLMLVGDCLVNPLEDSAAQARTLQRMHKLK